MGRLRGLAGGLDEWGMACHGVLMLVWVSYGVWIGRLGNIYS